MALAEGHTRSAASAKAGIHRSVFYDWVTEDPSFAEACDMAEAQAEAKVAQVLIDLAVAGRDWKATLAWLQHRRRQDWKPPTVTTEVSGPDGGPISLDDIRAKIARRLDGYLATQEASGDPG